MDAEPRQRAWVGFTTVFAAVWMFAAATGGATVLPALLCGACLVCALHGGVRSGVTEALASAFSSHGWRTALVIGLALTMIQFLPLELALFAAGDILAYVELVAAASLITASTRLGALRQGVKTAIQRLTTRVHETWRPGPGRSRARQAVARRTLSKGKTDDDGPAWFGTSASLA